VQVTRCAFEATVLKGVSIVEIIIVVLICIALVWIGGVFYSVRRGMNEVIRGLNVIDDRLERLERERNQGD
jgi:hypothetical protein